MENGGAEIIQAGYGLGMVLFFVALVVVVTVLNGVALWKAARNGSKGWFVALLLTNTIVLELLYIFVFSKSDKSAGPTSTGSRSTY